MNFLSCVLVFIIPLSCNEESGKLHLGKSETPTSNTTIDTLPIFKNPSQAITGKTIYKAQHKKLTIPEITTHELVRFAKTLIGTKYKYGSTDPSKGFDCSGFITYVFNHFHFDVPRSSIDFTNIGQQIDLLAAKEGDLILFTGTNDSIKTVGHMGILTENSDTLKFIHATSGRANGVTISNLTEQYKKRFVKVIRISSK